MAASFEFFDHTADVGVRVTADTLPELLRTGGEALYAIIGQLETTGATRDVRLEFSGNDRAMLMRDYLGELLVLFESDQRVAIAVEVSRFDERRLQATARVAAVDERRSTFLREAKAVTYHELELRRTERGYQATFIVDI